MTLHEAYATNTIPIKNVSPVSTTSEPVDSISLKELERELPIVEDGQISLSDLLSRVVQAIFAEMTEIAETLPSMSDQARKRTLADFCVRVKKQVAKLYAVKRWSRDADVIQKCMNITSFILNHANQLDEVVAGITWVKDGLSPARLRNHDILTSLDILMTGTYQRLPTVIKEAIVAPKSMSRLSTGNLLQSLESLIRFRLRAVEILPTELSRFHINSGRVTFNVPRLFETSLTLSGSSRYDHWVFIHVEFLCNVAGSASAFQEFPNNPTGILKQFVKDEANLQLRYYMPIDPSQLTEEVGVTRVALPKGVVDAPLVRLYNFLQIMALAYQLEILSFQANRLRFLGWSEHIQVNVSNDRKTLKVKYWLRKSLSSQLPGQRIVPTTGGTLVISILSFDETDPEKHSRERILSDIRHVSQLEHNRRPSDTPERCEIVTSWQPVQGALGVIVPDSVISSAQSLFKLDPTYIDFEQLLSIAIREHTRSILIFLRETLLSPTSPCPFTSADEVTLIQNGEQSVLRVLFTEDSVLAISLDPRTGKIILKSMGDPAMAGRYELFYAASNRMNQSPYQFVEILGRLRYQIVLNALEQKTLYLGFQCFRQRNIPTLELARFGSNIRGHLFIQLHTLHTHYLTIVVTDRGYRFALIALSTSSEGPNSYSIMEDFGWIDSSKLSFARRSNELIHDIAHSHKFSSFTVTNPHTLHDLTGHNLSNSQLKELYVYCCARVNYLLIEQQLKTRGFGYSYVSSMGPRNGALFGLYGFTPSLCVQASDILAGAEAVEAVEPNVRIIPLSWWEQGRVEVLTSVKLKEVQPAVREKDIYLPSVIRPTSNVVYDSQEGVVTVVSPSIENCVLNFLSKWSKISRMIVIVQQISRLSLNPIWSSTRLLSFDVQIIRFEYYPGHGLMIMCPDSAVKPAYLLQFFRTAQQDRVISSQVEVLGGDAGGGSTANPHIGISHWASRILEGGSLSSNFRLLLALLRISLPVLLELQAFNRSEGNQSIVHFAKGLVWWRAFFPVSQVGLDFRIRPDFLLEILDIGSGTSSPTCQDPPDPTPAFAQPIPNIRLICQRISHSTTSLRSIPFESGLLLSCLGNVEATRLLIRTLINAIHDSVTSS